MVTTSQVEAMIKAGIPDAEVTVYSADGSHFEATVVSGEFVGKSLVQQHQMVYRTVQEAINSEAIHALALNTKANS
jgi:stress-induced morphogen